MAQDGAHLHKALILHHCLSWQKALASRILLLKLSASSKLIIFISTWLEGSRVEHHYVDTTYFNAGRSLARRLRHKDT